VVAPRTSKATTVALTRGEGERMQLASEGLLTYPGISGINGLCHIRVYEKPGCGPVVIVGQLEDNPGTAVNNAIETIAGHVQGTVINDGREFELITYHNLGGSPYSRVDFQIRSAGTPPADPSEQAEQYILIDGNETVTIYGSTYVGDFREPTWHHLQDINHSLGTTPREWERGEYTAQSVYGPAGAELREQLTAEAQATVHLLERELE